MRESTLVRTAAEVTDHEVAVVVVDINMPTMNGVQLLQRMKDNPRYRDIPIVIASTEGDALGWVIGHARMRGERHKLVWHSGGGPGFRSLLMRMVDARVTLVLLFNTTGEDVAGDEVLSERERWNRYRKVIKGLGKSVGEIVLRGSE